MKRYFDEPYAFIPPYRSEFWCRVVAPLMPRVLRKQYDIHRWEFRGTEHLLKSMDSDAGVLLTPNHCCAADPPVMGLLGIHLKRYFYYMASWHLFKQSKLERFKLNRTGAFSVFREGTDRDALRESARILANAERPLVVFPEGTWFRQNDRIGPLQEGMALITRRATKDSSRPILVHPVSIKYWYLDDPRPAMRQHLTTLETKLRWHPQRDLDLHARITKLSETYVTVKEIEFLGQPQEGELDRRIAFLCDHLLAELETKYLGRVLTSQPMDRVRTLLQIFVKKYVKAPTVAEKFEVENELHKTFFCQVLFGHSQEYLSEWPSVERLSESIKRIEEDLTGVEIQLGPMGVVVEIGEAIDCRQIQQGRGSDQELVTMVASRIQKMLSVELTQGPPTEWHCFSGPKPAHDSTNNKQVQMLNTRAHHD